MRRRLAISMAVIAASKPLLPPLAPARSMACSSVLVVSTPNATGTPVSDATWAIPLAALVAADDGAEADHRVVAVLPRHFARDHRHFPRAGNLDDIDQIRAAASAGEGIHRPAQQALRDEAVEAADDDRKAQPRRR